MNNENERETRYLKTSVFKKFLANDWRHMAWKVNGLVAGVILLIALVVTIICTMFTLMY